MIYRFKDILFPYIILLLNNMSHLDMEYQKNDRLYFNFITVYLIELGFIKMPGILWRIFKWNKYNDIKPNNIVFK